MTRNTPSISRRTALRIVAGTAVVGLAGCLQGDWTGSSAAGPLQRVDIDETTLIVELASGASVSQVNLIQPNGELFDQQTVPSGTRQVSFKLGTTYPPGEFRVVAQNQGEKVGEKTVSLQPSLQIQDVGLYRNVPDKPWDEVYGDTETDRLKNGEAFVTVENTGSGPEAVVELIFSGDVPNPVEDPWGSGMYETETVVVSPGETVDLWSHSLPFGAKSGSRMGCSLDGNSGQFTVVVETRVRAAPVRKTFDVRYSGSEQMHDCDISITCRVE